MLLAWCNLPLLNCTFRPKTAVCRVIPDVWPVYVRQGRQEYQTLDLSLIRSGGIFVVSCRFFILFCGSILLDIG